MIYAYQSLLEISEKTSKWHGQNTGSFWIDFKSIPTNTTVAENLALFHVIIYVILEKNI